MTVIKEHAMDQEIRNATIQQINIAFHPVEDRLLLKISVDGDAELAVWLTRRLVKGLWQLLQSDDLALQASLASQTGLASGITRKLDFDADTNPSTQIKDEAILLAKDCHMIKTANQQVSLELLCSNGQSIRLMLTPDLVRAFIGMLQLVNKETAWELPQTMHAPLMTAIQTSTVLH
jgi:hypothetical protein